MLPYGRHAATFQETGGAEGIDKIRGCIPKTLYYYLE
jgi:hypothetical protein